MSPLVRRILKIMAWAVGVVAALVAALVIYVLARWDAKYDRPVPQLSAPRDSASIARGEYIFKYQAMCWSCHTAGKADANSAPGGGSLFDLTGTGPGFGRWYSANITPDVESGIGGWSDAEIIQAIREGIRKDRTPLFPLMPVDWYHGIADSDALALVAYLRSIPPVSHRVTAHTPSLVAKALFTFGILRPKDAVAGPVSLPLPGVTVDYGKYIAQNLAGCMDCHTPRNLGNGEFYLDSLGAGSTFAYGSDDGSPIASYARNITPDKETGIGMWDEAQFITAVTTGLRPDGTVLVPHMPYAYLKFWTDVDLKAVYRYLQALPPIRRPAIPSVVSPALSGARGIERGGLLFTVRCRVCHGVEGQGAPPTSVRLAEVAPSLPDADLVDFIRAGNAGLKMPPFGKTLQDDELKDLLAYVRSWQKKE